MTTHPVRRTAASAAVLGLALFGFTPLGTAPAYAATTCTSGVPGDANGDGYAEVAVGSPGRGNGRGAVNVFYGQPSGLVAGPSGTARDDLFLTQDTPGVPGTADLDDAFGDATAFGDFNRDGCADLAIGAPGDSGRGSVTILLGSPSGLSTTGIVRLKSTAVTAKAEAGFGAALAAGDLNGDGVDDLAVGMTGLDVGKALGAGGVAVFYGSTKGLGRTLSPKVLTQASKGIPGTARQRDSIGTSLAIGNIDGRGRNELVIGSSEDHGYTGSVQVVKTTTHGFATSGQSAPITEDSPGLPARSTFNEFGIATAVGDVNGDGYADVAVGSPESDVSFPDGGNDNGAVYVFRGTSKGLTTKGSVRFSGGKDGVPGDKSSGGFGLAVALARFNADEFADLAIGVPSTTVGAAGGAGAVTVLLGGTAGITTTGGLSLTEATPGVGGDPTLYDGFGRTLTTALVRGTDRPSLVVGSPYRPAGALYGVGAVWELPAGSSSPQGVGSTYLTPDTAGVQGGPAAADTFFGGSLSSS